ncbi:MAG: MFS transporter [Gaiellales bacterium]
MSIRRETSWTRFVAAGTALIACTYGLVRFGFGLFLPVFRQEFGLSGSVAGSIAAGSFTAYCLAAAIAYPLVTRGHARRCAALAGLLAVVGSVGLSTASSTGMLALWVLIAGSGAGLASPALVALVDSGVPAPHALRAQTVVNAGTGLGVLAAGPLALVLTGHWRAAWLVAAALTALSTLAVWRLAPTAGTRQSAQAHTDAPLRSLRRLSPAVAAAILVGAGSAAVWTFSRDLISSSGGLGSAASTGFWILLGAAGVAGALTGDAVDRWSVPRTWILLTVLLAASTALLGVLPGTLAVAFGGAAVFGGSYVALSGVLIVWSRQLQPANPAGATAILFIALAAGQALGSVGLGSIADAVGTPTAFAAAATAAIISCIGLLPHPVTT